MAGNDCKVCEIRYLSLKRKCCAKATDFDRSQKVVFFFKNTCTVGSAMHLLKFKVGALI